MLKYLIRISSFFSRAVAEIDYAYRRLRGQAASLEAFEALLQKVQNYSPNEFNEYLRGNFTYQAEKIDFSMHYLVFLRKKKGDCDDYAHLAARLLERMGYETYLITVFADVKRGHAVCVGTKGGKSYGFGNWPLMHFTSPDFIEAGKTICRIGYDSAPEFIVKFDNRWRWLDYHQE
jgi:hypothetical protein